MELCFPQKTILPQSPSFSIYFSSPPSKSDFTIIKSFLHKSNPKSIYIAKHNQTNTSYIIKTISKKLIKSHPQHQNELNIIYSLNHPNLDKHLCHFETNNNIYFIIKNNNISTNLYNFISQTQYISNITIALIIKDIISAMTYLRKIHPKYNYGSIYPKNILIDNNNRPILSALILSGFNDKSQEKKLFLPPQKICNNHESDAWQIGCVLYMLITKKYPFSNTNNNDVLDLDIITDNKYAKDLIDKLLQVNPKEQLSFEKIMEHPFFKKYLCINDNKINNKRNIVYKEKSLSPLPQSNNKALIERRSNYGLITEDNNDCDDEYCNVDEFNQLENNNNKIISKIENCLTKKKTLQKSINYFKQLITLQDDYNDKLQNRIHKISFSIEHSQTNNNKYQQQIKQLYNEYDNLFEKLNQIEGTIMQLENKKEILIQMIRDNEDEIKYYKNKTRELLNKYIIV